MGLIKWLLEKRKKWDDGEEEAWDDIAYEQDELDIHNREERHKYINECLAQIKDASQEIQILSGEYNVVTSYLTDMEEIERLPGQEQEILKEICTKIVTLSEDKVSYEERKSRMPDELYRSMSRREEDAEEGIHKIDEAEKYQALIKQDMRKLDSEKSAYHYRRNELRNELLNLRGMTMIILGAIAFCFLLLFILQAALSFDTRLGYLLAGAGAAIVITFIYFRYANAERELTQVTQAIGRLVQLHNTVKIRYVNNTGLLDYLYTKYGVDSGAQLQDLWKQYQEEKEERRKFRRTELELDLYQTELMEHLKQYNITEPRRWLNQALAIIEPKEMVEIRHELIVRRQSLRKRMDYNKDVAGSARDEIMDVVKKYPEYADEIQGMVDRYEKMY